MRNRFVTLVFALLSSVLLAQTTPARPTVIALPLQAGPGLKADEADLGYAVQNVIENVLLAHGGLDYQRVVGRQGLLFASEDDLAAMVRQEGSLFTCADDVTAWVHGQSGAKEPMLNMNHADIVLRGRVSRKEESLLADLELWDRRSDKRTKRELTIDLPHLASFRQGFIEILVEAGLAPGSKQKESMLWKEDISLSALLLLAEGVGGDMLARFGDNPQSATPLDAAVRLISPQSYLALNWQGWLHHRNLEYAAAKESFARALKINPAGVDAIGGMMERALQRRDKASAESFARRTAEVREEPEAYQISRLRHRADELAQYEKILERASEAHGRLDIGNLYREVGDFRQAIGYLEQGLEISREAGFRDGESRALNDLGLAFASLGQYEKAVGYLKEALQIKREVNDLLGEGRTLSNLGTTFGRLSRYETEIGYYEQALVIERKINDRKGEATTLANLGVTYDDLGSKERAISYYRQAQAILSELVESGDSSVFDSADEAIALARLYAAIGQRQRAIGYLKKALKIRHKFTNQSFEAATLNSLGRAYSSLARYKEATRYYHKALASNGNEDKRAFILLNLAGVYAATGRYEIAVGAQEQALEVARRIKDRTGEALAFDALMKSASALDRRSLAIFYGKQSVNVYQLIRNDIRGLSKDIQKGYLESHADTYRTLAELLAAEGRIAEAEQVLRLLKDEEYSEFVRDASAKSTETLSLNSHEKAVQSKYDELSKPVTAIGERLAVLSKKGQAGRTAEENAEWKELSEKREQATARFNEFLKSLDKEFAGQEGEAVRMNEIASGRSMMRTLSDMGPGTVAVYTLTAKNRYIAFLLTPNAQISKEYAISSEELGTKIMNFRDAVINKRDPLPLAQELYRIIVEPIEKDLEGAGAKTIMWSLDGTLRYLPIAALHDVHQYMLERYQNVVFQPNRPLHTTPSAKWDALALGVSKPHETESWRFPPLTNVPAELRAIVKSDENHAGALPGTEKLDEQFTWDAMVDELGRRSPTVVHIASHFEFAAGDDAASVLLLGDGTTLSLKKLKSQTNLFNNVDLLTLSACNTALTGGGQESGDGKQNGQEVDGLAITAEDQGAASVLATLWPVYDPSTSALMSKFYALHESSPTMTKAEALRQAQLALLHGAIAAQNKQQNDDHAAPTIGANGRSAESVGEGEATPRSVSDYDDYTHPYYWAPFILMGNWK